MSISSIGSSNAALAALSLPAVGGAAGNVGSAQAELVASIEADAAGVSEVIQNLSASLGTVIGPSVAKAQVADIIERLLEVYIEERRPEERFLDTVRRLGVKPFKERAYAAPIAA